MTTPSRSAKLFEAILDRLQVDLAYGAADRFRTRFYASKGDTRGPAQAAGELLGYLATPEAARMFRPGRTFANEGETTLEAMVRRMPLAKPSEARELTESLWLELGHLPPDRMASTLAAMLDGPLAGKLGDAVKPPASAAELRVRAALDWYGPDVDSAKREAFVKEMAPRAGHLAPAQVLRKISEYLSMPHIAERITRTGRPIEFDARNPIFFSRDAAAAFDREVNQKLADEGGETPADRNRAAAVNAGIGI